MKYTRRQFLRGLALALPSVAWPGLAWAQEPGQHKVYLPIVGGSGVSCTGTFPEGNLVDNFNRPDGPLGANWTIHNGCGGVEPTISGNVAVNPDAVQLACAYFNATIYGPCCTASFRLITMPSDGMGVQLGACNDGADEDGGYGIWVVRNDAGGDTVTLWEGHGASSEFAVILSDGDKFALVVRYSTIELWQCKPAGAWTQIGIVAKTLTSYPAGYVWIMLEPGDAEIDDVTACDLEDCNPPQPEAAPVTTHCTEDPVLALVCANGDRLDLITWEAGFELDDPGWRPQVAQFKGGGSYANSQIAEGQTLVAGEYDNVVETIPLVARGTSEAACVKTYRRLQQFIKRASDYWKEPSEYDCVWLEVRPLGVGCRIGYARVIKAACADFASPFGQPFASQQPYSVADGLSLVVEREPLWRAVPPGEMIGPLYNLLKNPDFEQWNSGVADSQPDCWSDVEIGGITGTNGRDTTSPKWGQAALVVDVSNSTGAGQAKGVTQAAEGTEDGQEYTLVAWVRNAGVTNGVGRILITSLLGQYEVYRSATQHGWMLYTETFTTGVGDVVGVNCEILSTAAGTDGTVYFDSLMLLKGDWEQEALDGMLPYMTSSHIFNHWDTGAGHLNYVDAWEVPGDADALTRLEITNNTTPANPGAVVELLHDLRIGQRRTGDVGLFDFFFDPIGVPDATASGASRVTTVSLNQNWQDVSSHLITGASVVRSNEGRFRLLARVWDPSATPTLQSRLKYYLGSPATGLKILDETGATISGAWETLDLTPTKAMIFDQKRFANPSGQVGYKVQMRRTAGTGVARLDYIIALPTDGGYLHAELTPSLTQGQTLVADNTASLQISSTLVRNGWKGLFASNLWGVTDFHSFKGSMYAAIEDSAGATGRIYRQGTEESSWTVVFNGAGYGDPGSSLPQLSLEEYNGELYCGGFNAGGATLWRTSDGSTWTAAAAEADKFVLRLKAIGDRLYFSTDLTGYPGDTHVRYWDGAAVTTIRTLNDEAVTYLEEYDGKLYASIGLAGRVEVYDPATGLWAVSKATGADFDAQAMKEFNGKLYVSGAARIWAFDGSTWTLAANLQLGYHPWVETGYSMEELDGTLYLAGVHVGATATPVFASSDGTTWEPVYDPGAFICSALYASQGALYLGVIRGAGTGLLDIYRLALGDVVANVADYEGGGFTAPNRRLLDDARRHKWVFSCSRPDGSNVISDEMLVGIGYVSRFLSLIGEG